MKLSQGTVLAERYEIIEQIGIGGMAVVYRARDRKLDRDVTVKVMREEYNRDEDFIRRFNIEARSAASLSNNNIVNVYDVGVEDEVNFIVMEYIDGITLKELIDMRAPFENEETLGVAIQIATALSHAHQNDIIHRDIKPQNIMVTKGGIVKVMDFGIARAASSATTTTSSNAMGSVHYFSPEQARGKYVDVRSDIYSLGIVMFEMATGQIPFDGDSAVTVALKHINEPVPDMKNLNPHVSDAIEKIILKATSKLSSQRYANIDEMISDLKRAITNESGEFVKTGSRNFEQSPTIMLGGEELKTIRNDARDYYDFDQLHDDKAEIEYFEEEDKDIDKNTERKIVIAAVLTAFAIIAVLSSIGFRIYTGSRPVMVTVPSIVGFTVEDAVEELLSYNIQIGQVSEEASDTFMKGLITYQSPGADSVVNENTAIDITVSTGFEQIEMPLVIGNAWNEQLDKDRQIEELYEHDLRVSVIFDHSDDYPEMTVYNQDPAAGTLIDKGSSVTLYISRGVELRNVAVPNLAGYTLAQAQQLLEDRGLFLGEPNYFHNSEYPEGQITRQLINPGAIIAQGSTVDVIVSLGPNPQDTVSPPSESVNVPQGSNSKTLPIVAPDRLVNGEAETVHISVVQHTGSVDIVLAEIEAASISSFPFEVTVTGESMVAVSVLVDGRLTHYETVDLTEEGE